MTRARRRQARTQTEDGEWSRRRDYVMRNHPGDTLLESSEFWRREPDVPDELREDSLRWRDLLAPEPVASEMRAERAELLDRRMDWLTEHGYR